MRQKSVPAKEPANQIVTDIRRATRRHFSPEDKIRVALEGLRGEDSIAALCRGEGIVETSIPAGRRTSSKRADQLDAPTRRRLWGDRSCPAFSCAEHERQLGGNARIQPDGGEGFAKCEGVF